MLVDGALCQLRNELGHAGIEGGGVLVEEEHARRRQRRHDQRQRLTLAAGEQHHPVSETVLQPEAKRGDTLAEQRAPRGGERVAEAARRAAGGGEREILLHGELAAAPGERILKDARDLAGAARGRLAGDVGAVDEDAPAGGGNVAGDGRQQRRLAGAVGADDADELAGVDGEVDAVERTLLQRRAAAEGDGKILDADHAAIPPRLSRGRISASATRTAVTRLRSDALRPMKSVDRANWMATR